MAEKRVAFTNEYKKRRGPSHDSRQFNYNNTENRNQTGGKLNGVNQQTDDAATEFLPRNNWNHSTRNNSVNSGRG